MIDWFTVVAQVINFLILVFLLKRFLYKPILRSIETRRKNIAAQFEEAEVAKAEGEKLRAEYEKKNAQFEDERDLKLKKVREDVEAERVSRENEAKRRTDEARAQLRMALSNETRDLQDQIRTRARTEAFELAKKVIADLTSSEVESALVDRFVEHLSKLDAGQRELLQRSHNEVPGAKLTSTFNLNDDQLHAISKTLDEVMETRVKLSVEEPSDAADRDELAGLELDIGSQRIYWGFNDYLETIEQASALDSNGD